MWGCIFPIFPTGLPLLCVWAPGFPWLGIWVVASGLAVGGEEIAVFWVPEDDVWLGDKEVEGRGRERLAAWDAVRTIRAVRLRTTPSLTAGGDKPRCKWFSVKVFIHSMLSNLFDSASYKTLNSSTYPFAPPKKVLCTAGLDSHSLTPDADLSGVVWIERRSKESENTSTHFWPLMFTNNTYLFYIPKL